MTSITLIVTGASVHAEVNGILTSGMVGIPVSIRYDEAWNGLTKNLVCRCGRWDSASGDVRTILNVGAGAVVAHEVMQPETVLFLGIEGFSADGSLVIPTIWANCGYIHPGTTTGADLSATITLPIWDQLSTMIGSLDELDTEAKANLVEAINEAAKSCNGSCADQAGYVKSVNETEPDENGNVEITIPDSGGLNGTEKNLILSLFRNAAYTSADMNPVLTQLETLWSGSGEAEPDDPVIPDEPDPEKTLTGISATYSGGSVPVGTAVTALTGIVVTAHYSDDTSETVTGYTLSGTIAEGENLITVSYGGMTTTITVVGIASGEDVPADNQYEYTIDHPGYIGNATGGLEGNGLYNTTGLVDLDADATHVTIAVNVPVSDEKTVVNYYIQWFNGEEFNSRTGGVLNVPAGDTKAAGWTAIASGATKFRVTVQTNASKFLLYKGKLSVNDVQF